MTADVRIATCLQLPEVDVDAAPLAAAFARHGIKAELLAWDDPSVDWDLAIPTVLRSTWNYVHHLDEFLTWCDRVHRAGALWNSPAVVRMNVHKGYLLELAARGVATAPTLLVRAGETFDVVAASADRQWSRIVIKPAVGAGSFATKAFSTLDAGADAQAHLQALVANGRDALVQPYLASVDDYGERSMVFIDGEVSHAIRKAPRFDGEHESITGPFPIADDERAVAHAALGPWKSSILYGRVDLARDEHGQPRVMELEMIEPSLFFARHAPAVDRFVDGVRRRIK